MAATPHEPLLASNLPEQRVRRWLRPLARFLHVESAGGVVLLICTVIALALANSPAAAPYQTPSIPAQRLPAEPPRHTPWQAQHRDDPAGPDQEFFGNSGDPARAAQVAAVFSELAYMMSLRPRPGEQS